MYTTSDVRSVADELAGVDSGVKAPREVWPAILYWAASRIEHLERIAETLDDRCSRLTGIIDQVNVLTDGE